MKRVRVSMLWEPRDLWVGVYWNLVGSLLLNVYVCLVPCVPILIQIWRGKTR